MSKQELFRDQSVVLEARKEVSAILKADHTQTAAQKMPMKFTTHRHVVQHLTGGIRLPAQAALHQFAGEFRCPLDNI